MKKQKKTLQQKLAERKVKIPNRLVWKILDNVVVKGMMVPKFGLHQNVKANINECKTGAFVIYNHQSRGEYIWLCQACYPRPLNFVVGYNEFFRSKFKLIFSLLHTIPKKNFTTDLTGMRGIDEIIKQNGVVCFSPEGMSSIVGHNQPIVNGTGAMFKHYNVPVYICKIKGGYLTNHKVCLDDRRGRVDTEFDLLLSPEQIQQMDGAAIDDLINKELWQDDYDWGKQVHVKWEAFGRIAYHLHDICYKCPKCGKELTMIGEGNTLKCTSCGNGATIDDYYDMHPLHEDDVLKETPSKWVDWERVEVIKEIKADPNYSYSVKCKLGMLPKYKYCKKNTTSEPVGEGLFTLDHNGLHFVGKRNGEDFKFDLSYKQVFSLVVVTDVTFFSLYIKGEYHEFYPETPCVGKLLLLTEEMHRLHVNTWKNFPWYDWMYKQN